jgi:hypothetical protein
MVFASWATNDEEPVEERIRESEEPSSSGRAMWRLIDVRTLFVEFLLKRLHVAIPDEFHF